MAPFVPLVVGYGPIFAGTGVRLGASADVCSDVRLDASVDAFLSASAGVCLGVPALLAYFNSGFAVF